MFEGEFGQSYVECVTRIGLPHYCIGLEWHWSLGGYCFVIARIGEILTDHFKHDRDAGERACVLQSDTSNSGPRH